MKYYTKEMQLSSLIRKVTIPDYQRDFVWNKVKQENLIRSLILEYPIGVLTAYEGVEKGYTLLDGLQRISTLSIFQSKPSEVMKFKTLIEIINVDFSQITDQKKVEKKINLFFKKWYEGLTKIESLDVDTYEFSVLFDNEFANKDNDEYQHINKRDVLGIYKKIVKKLKFIDVKIPVIVCTDFNDEQLADVFEKMNTGSMKLSKYEVFVAQWDKFGKITFDDNLSNKIASAIACRQKELKEEYDFEYESKNQKKWYLYEYMLTVSSELAEKGFALKNKDQIGYEVISLLLSNSVYGINKLVNKQFVTAGNYKGEIGNFLGNLFNIIVDECEEISWKIEEEEYKFAKYFRLITRICTKYFIDLDNLTIELVEDVNVVRLEELLNLEHEFDTERQTSYLHQMLQKHLDLDIKHKIPSKVYKITHAGDPHPIDKIRIQVRPILVAKEIKEKKYEVVMGEYYYEEQRFFVEFRLEHILKSQARNKSLYVQKNDIINFKNLGHDHVIIDDDIAVIKIMNEDYFLENYNFE